MSFTHEHSFTIAASPATVFGALTEAAQLTRWFAEHAEVGGGVGEPFRFWGRHTLDTPSADVASQRITRFERDRALGVHWVIGGVPTDVTITLDAHGDQTRAIVHHAVSGDLGHPRAKELIDDHWRLAFGNLMAYLAGGTGLHRPDYADPHPIVRQVVMIEAPRATVFRCLIDPALVNQWFGSTSAEVEPRAGGRYSVNWTYEIDGRTVAGGPTRIIEFVPDERLVLDWPDWRGDATVTGQTITFELETVGSGTKLTFTHAGFRRAIDVSDYPFGWSWFLSELTKVATVAAAAG